ncbi:MAG: hypothetical protein IJU16_01570 [Clostridia bacterium]|nr:hypothetical protein [Clostridia bacterium]
MARTMMAFRYTNPAGLMDRLAYVLQTRGYQYISENNENVWKNGMGMLTAMKYVKIEFAPNNTIVLSGWVRAVAGGEMDLNGFVGAIPKKQVMNVLQELQAQIR